MRRCDLDKLLKQEMDKMVVWDDVNDIVSLEDVAIECNLGISTPGDVLPRPMDELESFLRERSVVDVLIMGIQSERFYGGKTEDVVSRCA